MNRWMTAVVVAAGGGALMAMSAAHAASFAPAPSTTAAVPASEVALDAPVAGDLQQAVSTERSFAMKLHDWLATHFGGPIYVKGGTSVGQSMQLEAMLDVSQPQQGAVQQIVINPCPKLLATCTTQVLYIGRLTGIDKIAGMDPSVARAYPGEQALDVTDR